MRWWLCILISTGACGGAANKNATNAGAGTTPITTGDHGRGISLTGAGAYGDRHDPSGWSGVSTNPSAIGGGPPAAPAPSAPAPSVIAPTPSVSATAVVPAAPSVSAKPKPPAKTAPSAAPAPVPTLPPSKELDTSPPAKDLQF